jgi:hypothetical protein
MPFPFTKIEIRKDAVILPVGEIVTLQRGLAINQLEKLLFQDRHGSRHVNGQIFFLAYA